MKRVLFISVLAVLTLSSCVCHNLGLKTGLNVATISGDDTDNLSSRTGLFFGGFAELCVSNDVAIQPELLYSMQGAEYTMSEGYDGKFKLDYLNVPVMVKVKLTDELIVEAGPQVGILLSAKDEFTSSGDSGEEDIKDEVKGVDFGANLGLVYQFEGGLNIGARYNLGLSNINDFDGSDSFKNQNGVFQFSVGFRF
jgi:hypothetical protein